MQHLNVNRLLKTGSATVVLALLALALLLSACKDSPVNPEPPEATEYTVTLNLSPDGAVATDESGNTYSDGESLTQREGISLTLEVTATGYYPQTVTVTFDEDKTVTVTLDSEPPENVTLTFSIVNQDGDPVRAELFLKASGEVLASDKSSGEVTLPFSETALELCTRREFYATACQTVTPDENRALEFQIKQKTVTFSVTLDIRDVDETLLGPAGFTVRAGEVTQSDTLEFYSQDLDSPFELVLPMSNRSVKLSGESIYRVCSEKPSRGAYARCRDEPGITLSRLNRALASQSFVPTKDREITLELHKLIACQDGIDNDGDGNRDRGDDGCITDKGKYMRDGQLVWDYDPNDDVERLAGYTEIYPGSGKQNTFISSAKDHREIIIRKDNSLNPSIKKAVHIALIAEGQVESDQGGEAFAFRLQIGTNNSNVYTSDIIEDDGRNGWIFFRQSIPNNLFQDNQIYSFFLLHAKKVNGEPIGDGNDDIFFTRNDGVRRSRAITWLYEPEEVENEKAKAAFQRDEQSGVITRHFENISSIEEMLEMSND